jgi:hypothetical protein
MYHNAGGRIDLYSLARFPIAGITLVPDFINTVTYSRKRLNAKSQRRGDAKWD